jgi:hypothetical protein
MARLATVGMQLDGMQDFWSVFSPWAGVILFELQYA